MAPGTMLCDYSLYVCTFLSIAVTNMLAICFTQKKVPTQGSTGSGTVAACALDRVCVRCEPDRLEGRVRMHFRCI